MTDEPDRTPAAGYTASADERARRGRREVRLQLRPETAAVLDALAREPGRQAFSDAVNAILQAYDTER